MGEARFHAILFVRDEGDIIAQTLAHLAGWCDAVYVFDTGSEDHTWDAVVDASRRDCRIIPEFRGEVPFNSGLRAWGFERVRGRARDRDWFVRADADEFYDVRPREFIESRLRRGEGRVCAQMYDFVLTTRDVRAWETGEETIADRARPI